MTLERQVEDVAPNSSSHWQRPRFILTAVDGQQRSGGGGVDQFRIKIWDTTSGKTVYDTQGGADDDVAPTTPLAGDSIVIHTR